MLFYIEGHCLNIKQNFEFSCHFIDGEKLLPVVLGVVNVLDSKPLGFYYATFSVLPSLFKYHKVVQVVRKVVLHHWQTNSAQ